MKIPTLVRDKMIDPIKKSYRLKKVVLFLKPFKVEDSILLFSETRSGSTWISDQLLSIPNTILNWEPAHKNSGVFNKIETFGWRIIIPKESTDKRYKKLVKNTLTLNLISPWTTKFIHYYHFKNAKTVITKFVRANNILPWITKEFNFKHKPILLVRHPIATALSQMKTFDFQAENKTFEIPDVAHNELYYKYKNALSLVNDTLTHQVANWCINYVKVLPNKEGKWHVVYYEDVLENPEEEVKKLNENCNLSLKYDEKTIAKPSGSNFEKDYKEDIEEQLGKWQSQVTEEQKKRVQEILDAFGITEYSAYSIKPIKK